MAKFPEIPDFKLGIRRASDRISKNQPVYYFFMKIGTHTKFELRNHLRKKFLLPCATKWSKLKIMISANQSTAFAS